MIFTGGCLLLLVDRNVGGSEAEVLSRGLQRLARALAAGIPIDLSRPVILSSFAAFSPMIFALSASFRNGGAADEATRVVPAHVVGIVGAHHDVIGSPQVHEVAELFAVEHDGVEVELGQRLARLLLEHCAGVHPRAPHVVHAPRIVRDVSHRRGRRRS